MFDIRSLFRSTFIYTLLGFLPMASAFVLTPVYTRYMSTAEYGLVALASIFQSYLSIFIAIGIDSAFTRFFFKYRKRAITNALLSTSLISILSISLVLYIVFLAVGPFTFSVVFGTASFSYQAFGHFIFVTAMFSIAYSIIAQYYRDTENLRSFTLLAVAYFICVTVGSYIGIVTFRGGAQGSIIGKMAGTLVTMGIYLGVFFYKTGFVFKIKYARQMYIYGYPLVIYALLATTFDSMDRFFLNRNFLLSELGKYNLAFVVASTIGIVLNSMQSAISPNVYKLSNSNDPERHAQINLIYRYMLWATLFIVVACIAASYPVILHFINPDYHGCLIFIPLLALGWMGRAYFMVYSNPLFFHGKTAYLPLINGISVIIGLIANYALIHAIGIMGICLAVVIIKISQALLTALFLRKTGLFHPVEYGLKGVNTGFILITAIVLAVSSGLVPDIYGMQLKYFLPLIGFAVLFLIFNPAFYKRTK
ncbi:MAG: Polysaccharide biosynthesis protein [Bacteroidetes bacterium]|nr:Polysaccharide biosynthesis protein [Bacteroidota bacterium]